SLMRVSFYIDLCVVLFFFFSSRRRHTRSLRDWSSDVCSSDLGLDTAFAFDPHFVKPCSAKWGSKANAVSRPYARITTKLAQSTRSEERRVGKEGRSRWSPYH